MQGPYVLGVDFGTTHTVAAVLDEGGPRVLLLEGAESQFPSCVLMDQEQRLVAGRAAQRAAVLQPEMFLAHPKQHIDEPSYLFGTHEVPLAHVIAAVFARVDHEARRQYGGAAPSRVVLTHPAGWVGRRLDTLRRAAAIAGWTGVELLAEPVAAAAYHLGPRPEPQAVAVYDLGGGTFDAAVVVVDPDGSLRVAADGGQPQVGGVHFDNALLGLLHARYRESAPELWDGLMAPATRADRNHRRLLLEDIRFAKERLSESRQQFVPLPGDAGDAVLTREELERLVGPAIELTLDSLARTVAAAGVTPTRLYPVGGSSRMPLVHTALHARFGYAPITQGQPEHVVALGAAVAPQGLGTPAASATSGARPHGVPAPPPPPPPPPPLTAPLPLARVTPRSKAGAGWIAGLVAALLVLVTGGVVAAVIWAGQDDPSSSPNDPGPTVTCADGDVVERRSDCPPTDDGGETCPDGTEVDDLSQCPDDTSGCFVSGAPTADTACTDAARAMFEDVFGDVVTSNCTLYNAAEFELPAGELYQLSCPHGGDTTLVVLSWWESTSFARDDVLERETETHPVEDFQLDGVAEGGLQWWGVDSDGDTVYFAAYDSGPLSVWVVGPASEVESIVFDHGIFLTPDEAKAAATEYAE